MAPVGAEAAREISPEQIELENASKQIKEQQEQMRKEAEQADRRMQEFKHQMGEKEKEVAAAKELAKKAAEKAEKKRRKESEKRAAAAKLLSDEERQRKMKSLAVEAALMVPPATTSVAGPRKPTAGVEKGKGKGARPAGTLDVVVGSLARTKGAGLPTMVPHRGPLSVDLGMSPELGTVFGLFEELEDVSTLAEVLAGIPPQEVAKKQRLRRAWRLAHRALV